MSNLLSSNNQAKDRRAAQSEPVVSDTSFLVPPQEEKSEKVFPTAGHRSWLIPPQEEKIDVAALRGEQGKLHIALCPRYVLLTSAINHSSSRSG